MMAQQTVIPRLHMGCGEALRSQWLLSVVRSERKPEVGVCTLQAKRPKRGATRG